MSSELIPEQVEDLTPPEILREAIGRARLICTSRTPLARNLLFLLGVVAIVAPPLWLYYYSWPSDDMHLKAINFAAAWFPFAISILIAIIPDLDQRVRRTWKWRVVVVGVGFSYSFLLWHQVSFTISAGRNDVQSAVSQAVGEANKHTDEQIGTISKRIADENGDLHEELRTLSGQLAKSESDLSGSISKVAVIPPKYAQLQFSLASPDSSHPLLRSDLLAGPDDSVSVDFMVTNISDTEAEIGELWVFICEKCAFAAEPDGFDKPPGSSENVRHKVFQFLNPGVTLSKMNLRFKFAGAEFSAPVNRFEIGFRYSCKTCGKAGELQRATVTVTRTAASIVRH